MINNAAASETFATGVEDTGGCYVVPAFVGLGAPYWDQYARGIIVGLTRGVEQAHIIRATLESLAYQSYDVIKAMEADAGTALKTIRVDGGASANNFLMQFQADILGVDVIRPAIIESTALGAVYLAGLAVGFYTDREDIKNNVRTDKTFTPKMPPDTSDALIKGWREAVTRSFGWAK